MTGKTMTQKHFAALITASMLSPLLRSLPRAVVKAADKDAWLCIFPAFLLLLFLYAIQGRLLRKVPPGKGYADLILHCLGPVAGRIILILYGIWFLFYSGFILRSGTERLVAAVYPERPILPFMIVMTTLCLVAALGTLRAAGRAAFLLRSFLLAALTLVFIFAAPNISRENLTPIFQADAAGILLGSFSIAAIGGLGGCFPFLLRYVEPFDHPVRKAVPLVLICLAVAGLLCFEIVGTFGAALTEKLAYPFFLMVRDISIFHVTQRIEAVVVVFWIFADFILCSSMLRCAHECIRTVFHLPDPETEPALSLKGGKWLIWIEAALIPVFGFLVTSSAFELEKWADGIVPLAGLFMFYALLPVIAVIGGLRDFVKAIKRHGP